VVISAVHDAARAAVEREAHIPEAHGVARRAIQRAAGGLLRDLNVMVDVTREEGEVVTVRADAVIRAPLRPRGVVPRPSLQGANPYALSISPRCVYCSVLVIPVLECACIERCNRSIPSCHIDSTV
jgi:hypothetical protein